MGERQVRSWRLPLEWQSATCLCSPLLRARGTASLLQLDYQLEERLIEMDWGKFEGMTLACLRADSRNNMPALESAGIDFRPPGGESPRDVVNRLRPLIASVRQGENDQIWITHKGVRNACLALATGWEMKSKPPFKLQDDHGIVLTVDQLCQPRDTYTIDLRADG